MIRTVSRTTEFCYVYAVKPILFRQSPDGVHRRMIKTAARLQKSPTLLRIIRATFRYKNSTLEQTIEGIQFKNPVGLSAGLDKNFEILPMVNAIGFGFMEGGSVTFQPYDGNPRPWFHRLPRSRSLVVNVGLANHGIHEIIARFKKYTREDYRGFPVNVSIAKTNSLQAASESDAIDDYVASLKELEKAHVGDMYTLNISCPNTFGGEPFTTPSRLDSLLKATDGLLLTKPLFIKMPIDLEWRDFKKLTDVAAKHHVNGLTIGNLAKKRDSVKHELPDSIKGNLSGKPTQKLSDELIKETYKTYDDRFTIIGVGGIFTAEDAYTKIKNGAHLVELITGLIFNGPQAIGRINRDLDRLLRRDGYANISEAVGKNVRS